MTTRRSAKQHLQVIIDEADRLNMLVGDLLIAFQDAVGQRWCCTLPNSTSRTRVQSIINTYKIMEDEQGYTFRFNCSGSYQSKGDADKIKQVVSNLLTNAIKFAGEDKTVIVTLKRRGRSVICRVEDHGIGIAPEELNPRMGSATTVQALIW